MELSKSTLEDLGMELRRFGVADYLVFVFMLLICVFIGIYYGFFAGKTSVAEYLMGGRNMQTFPVALSLIASGGVDSLLVGSDLIHCLCRVHSFYISGITLLGTPTEIYLYGTQYLYITGGVIAMGVIMHFAYLPVFHDMQLTSTYEYLERRFNKQVRLFGSLLFSVTIIIWLPIVIYVPALAFNQVTGINVHIITPAVCVVCIFYTCVGGLKAVVWTDVVQTLVMIGAMILVIVKGTIDVGGFSLVLERNYENGRIEAPNWDLNPTIRHTVWVLVLGGCMNWLQSSAMNQYQMQRYLALPTLSSAKNALWIFIVGSLTIIFLCSYSGLLIYATYYNCDPLTTKLVAAKDQLLPLLVMDTLKDLPGLPGLFVAGVFSAALSSMSTGLNSMAAVVLEDFYKTLFSYQLSPQQTGIFLKTVVVILGAVCFGLVFVAEKLGTVLQLSISLTGVTYGTSLGIFTMGLFLPWINSKSALIGGISGMGFMSWVCLGTQAAIASGRITFDTKPVSVEGCTYEFVTPSSVSTVINSTAEQEPNEVFVLYQISYQWYTMLGAVVSMSVALIVCCLTGPTDPTLIDPMLLSPVIRRFFPRKQKQEKDDVDMGLFNSYKKT